MYGRMPICSSFSRRLLRIRGICWITPVSRVYSIGMWRRRNRQQSYAWIRNTRPSTMPFSSKCIASTQNAVSSLIYVTWNSVCYRLLHVFALSTPSMDNQRPYCFRSGFCMWRASCACYVYAARNISNWWPQPMDIYHLMRPFTIWWPSSIIMWPKVIHFIVASRSNELKWLGISTETELDGINMMIELVGSMQSQGEATSRMFVDAIVIWQSKIEIGNAVISATINAIGSCKTFSLNLLILLEATTFNYFRYLGMPKNRVWQTAIQFYLIDLLSSQNRRRNIICRDGATYVNAWVPNCHRLTRSNWSMAIICCVCTFSSFTNWKSYRTAAPKYRFSRAFSSS